MTQRQRDKIGEAIDSARMIRLGLGSDEHTEQVREELRLHHSSWIIGPLQAALGHDGVKWEYDWQTKEPGKLVTLDRRRPL